ncbi:hypothetical protein, partial [Escherichia coli]|uniref:hypothetical protein n=1 Tax=Escherichia coli TaxID=562 RepID=UPI001CA580D7
NRQQKKIRKRKTVFPIGRRYGLIGQGKCFLSNKTGSYPKRKGVFPATGKSGRLFKHDRGK